MKQTIINNEYKWKSIATIGIWFGVALGIMFSKDSVVSLLGMIATLIIWMT